MNLSRWLDFTWWKNTVNPIQPSDEGVVRVDGDKNAPPTPSSKLLLWYHMWRYWRRTVVFEVEERVAESGYFLAFAANGSSKYLDRRLHLRRFQVRRGHEDQLYAVFHARNLRPVKLTFVAESYVGNPLFADVPLF